MNPEDPKLPESAPRTETPAQKQSSSGFALKALGGFLGAPLVLALCLPAQSPAPFWLLTIGTFAMLFSNKTRPFALGAILFLFSAFLLLLAICGRSLG